MKWPQVFMVVWFAFNVFMTFNKAEKMRLENKRGEAVLFMFLPLIMTALLIAVLYCGGFWE